MKAKCINADPLGWLEEGKVYDCIDNGNVVVFAKGFAISKERFNNDFRVVEQ